MTFDDQGRLVVGLDNTGVARMTLADNPHDIRFEKVESTLSHCRGVLYAYESLYVSATNSKEFYRLRDTNGDDRFDESTLLKEFDYRSRYGHGTNQIVLGPDGLIYLVIGNDVSFPAARHPTRPIGIHGTIICCPIRTTPVTTIESATSSGPIAMGGNGRSLPAGCAIKSTWRSIATAKCSRSTPTWNWTWDSPGIDRHASTI